MRHARRDYDAIQPWPTKRPHIARDAQGHVGAIPGDWERPGSQHTFEPIIPDDEPVLLIRGQDLAALPALDAWVDAAMNLGADKELIDAVLSHRRLIETWQQERKAKVPDADKALLRS